MILYNSKKNIERKGGKKNPKLYQTTMPGGRPPKKARSNRNISGLKKHPQPSPVPSEPFSHPTPPRSQAPSPEADDGDESDLEVDDEDLELLIHFDSVKTNFGHEEEFPDEEEEAEDEELCEWEGFRQEDLVDAMLDMFEDDDEKDLDWLPPALEEKRKKRKKNSKGKYLLTDRIPILDADYPTCTRQTENLSKRTRCHE